MNNKKKAILVIVIIALVVVVYFMFTSNTPAQAPTTTSTPTTSSTPAPTSTSISDIETQDYEFDAAVAQYEMENALTDEDIIADASLKQSLFDWLEDQGVTYDKTLEEQEAGCDSPFIDEYLTWIFEKYNGFKPGEQPTEPTQPSDTESSTPSNVITDEEMAEIIASGGDIMSTEEASQIGEENGQGVHEAMNDPENLAKLEALLESLGH